MSGATAGRASPLWVRMRPADLPAMAAMAAALHPDYPEDPAIFAERLALAPAFCRVLRDGHGGLLGYALTHPWAAERGPPALDSLLGGLPPHPDAWHIHDIALGPEARGGGHARALLLALGRRAGRAGLRAATLVAIAGKGGYWRRLGFAPAPTQASTLASYGADSVYMRRALPPPGQACAGAAARQAGG